MDTFDLDFETLFLLFDLDFLPSLFDSFEFSVLSFELSDYSGSSSTVSSLNEPRSSSTSAYLSLYRIRSFFWRSSSRRSSWALLLAPTVLNSECTLSFK